MKNFKFCWKWSQTCCFDMKRVLKLKYWVFKNFRNFPLGPWHRPLTIDHLPWTTYHWPLTIDHLPLTTYHWPLTTYHWSLTMDHLPLTTYHWPLTTYHLPLTIYHLPSKFKFCWKWSQTCCFDMKRVLKLKKVEKSSFKNFRNFSP